MSRAPQIVVTVPARSASEARTDLVAAAAAGADLAEIRFDRWPEPARLAAAELFPSPIPLIATLRSSEEGGEGPTDPTARQAWRDRMAALPFAYLDLELSRDRLEPSSQSGPKLIGSRHFPERTSVDTVKLFLGHSPASCAFVKAVVPLSVGRFVHELLPAYRGWTGRGFVVMTTGPSGPLSRLWASQVGQPLVFAAMPTGGGATPVEPSQIPVDQLRRLWTSARPRMFAVLGHPVSHSLSPLLHGGWLASEGRPAAYVALDVADPAEFDDMVALGRAGNWTGWSVTHPWKSAAARVADRPSEAVRRTKVANTLHFRAGEIAAELTDSAAVERRSNELLADGRWDGREALVVGSGGAARAAVFALRTGRCTVLLAGRTPARVAELANDLGGRPVDETDRHPVGLVVHATTVGRAPAGHLEPPLDGWLGTSTTVLDFVYAAADPQVAWACERAGARYEDGRRLLVYQAAESHRIWWGEPPRGTGVADALRRVGCAA
jgi:shikimate dehydrogenase/3-dehydroquinate dehydratase type I